MTARIDARRESLDRRSAPGRAARATKRALRRRAHAMVAGIAVLLALLLAQRLLARELVAPATVLYLDEQGQQHIDLQLLEPLTPQLRAILALYAFARGTNCEADEGQPLRCDLTTALGLGAQCSPDQIGLIRHWFGDGIPAFGEVPRKVASRIQRYGLERWCYSAPTAASHQVSWDALQVDIAGDQVTVRARSSWINTTERAGDDRTLTVFRVLGDRVEVVRDEVFDGDVVDEEGASVGDCAVEPVPPETGPGRARLLDWLRAHPGATGGEIDLGRAEVRIAALDNADLEEYVLTAPAGAAGRLSLIALRAVGTGWTRIARLPFPAPITPYVDPISGRAEPLVRSCGHVYVNLLGGKGANAFRDTHVWKRGAWREVCAAAWVREQRRGFQRLFDHRLYREAHAFLDGVARACEAQAATRTWLWMQSDLALTAHRMGDDAACLVHIAAAERSPALARAGTMLRRPIATNAALCRQAPGRTP